MRTVRTFIGLDWSELMIWLLQDLSFAGNSFNDDDDGPMNDRAGQWAMGMRNRIGSSHHAAVLLLCCFERIALCKGVVVFPSAALSEQACKPVDVCGKVHGGKAPCRAIILANSLRTVPCLLNDITNMP